MREETTQRLAAAYAGALALGGIAGAVVGIFPAWVGGAVFAGMTIAAAFTWPRRAPSVAPDRATLGPSDGIEGLLHHGTVANIGRRHDPSALVRALRRPGPSKAAK